MINKLPNDTNSEPCSEKYQAAIIWLLLNAGNTPKNRERLSKLLYLSDTTLYLYNDGDRTITSEEYIHLLAGPTPKNIDKVLDQMIQRGILRISFKPSALLTY